MRKLDLPFTLELQGPIPAKKQNWRPGKGGQVVFYGGKRADGTRQDVRAEYIALVTQARLLWGSRRACIHPALRVQLCVTWRGADRDNKLSTVLDVLVEAGVLKNDNIANCNGLLELLPACVCGQDRAVIHITGEAVQ